jgi:hypothetical protein
VYAHALFTIIAASGDSADASLPGVRVGTRDVTQDVLNLREITLMSVLDFQYKQERAFNQEVKPYSSWYSRAWTM